MKLDRIGIGIDVARYVHWVQFVGPDKTPLRRPLRVPESSEGYRRLEQVLRQLYQHFGQPRLHVVLEEANVYGRNLRFFLQQLARQGLPLQITSHNPLAAKRYKQAFLQDQKNDRMDSFSEARFAVTEQPPPSTQLDPILETLRVLVSHLHALSKDLTRRTNRLRALLSLVFPELLPPRRRLSFSLLCLLARYPTAQAWAQADLHQLATFRPFPNGRPLGLPQAQSLQKSAQHSVGCLQNEALGHLIRSLCIELQHTLQLQRQLQKQIQTFYQQHRPNLLLTIPGVGPYTAAVLTAVIGDPYRFPTAAHLIGYLGLYPTDHQSGQRQGRKTLSKKGNPLARHALFLAALSASRCNPAIRALYLRQIERGKSPLCALGHCMRKLATIILAVLQSGRPFDPNHFPWEAHGSPSSPERQPETEPPASSQEEDPLPTGPIPKGPSRSSFPNPPAPSSSPIRSSRTSPLSRAASPSHSPPS